MDAASYNKLCRIAAYLLANARSSTTQMGAVYSRDYTVAVPARQLQVNMDLRLPNDIDDNGPNGLQIGKPGSLAADVLPMLYLASSDARKTTRIVNIDQPYPMVGDMVAVASGLSVDAQITDKVVIKEADGASPGLYVGRNKATAVDGVYPAPYAVHKGFALLGPPRQALATVSVAPVVSTGKVTTLQAPQSSVYLKTNA